MDQIAGLEIRSLKSTLKTKEVELNFGPQHPATHGVLRVILKLDGERVVDSDPVIGYLHRGIEKWSEFRTYPKAVPIYDRLDYISAVLNCEGFVETVEKLMGIEIPKRAQYIRVILSELNRIASHLFWLGTHALDIGAMGIFFYALREREAIMDLFEAMIGQRLLPNAFPIGGVRLDFPKGWIESCRKFLKAFPERIDEYEGLLTENRIWNQRTREVGIISAEDAVDLGLTGPPLRASGVYFDVRKAMPYSSYEDFDFIVPLGTIGDTFDRYIVRIQEMRQSVRIISQALDGLPDGDLKAKIGKLIKPPAGEAYHTIEGSKGQLGYYIVSDGSDKPYRVHVRGPSFVNMQGFRKMAEGCLIADVVAVIGSLDIVLGEIDR